MPVPNAATEPTPPLAPEEIVPRIRSGHCKKIAVPGIENVSYFADRAGHIYSLNTPTEPKCLDQKLGGGLLWVTLYSREGVIRRAMVGDVMAHTFLADSPRQAGDTTVIYRDGDPTNNTVENLEWGTPLAQKHQLRAQQTKQSSGHPEPLPDAVGLHGVRTELDIPLTADTLDDPLLGQLHWLQERLDHARAREADLVEALAPFAQFELSPHHAVASGTAVVIEANKGTNRHSRLMVQAFRHARRVLDDTERNVERSSKDRGGD